MAQLRRITALWTGLAGLPGTSTMYFDSEALSLGDLLDGLDLFWNQVVTMGGTSSGGLQEGLTITLEPTIPVIDTDTGGIVGFQTITDVHAYAGNGTGEPLPPATQMLIEWHGDAIIAGRSPRGRTFIGGLTEDHSTSGVPAATPKSEVQSAAQSLCLESMAIYSPTHHAECGVDTAHVWTQFAVLRSRRD